MMVTERSRAYFFAAIAGGLAVLGAAAWTVAHRASQRSPEPRGQATEVAASTAADEQVARELKRLDLALRSAERRLNALQVEAPNRAVPAAAEPAPREEPLTPAALQARQREEQRAWDEELVAEPRDESWATEYERRLRELATDANGGHGTRVTDMVCRTSICRLNVTHEVRAERQSFTMDLMQRLVDTAGARIMPRDDATTFYVVRKGYPMPDLAHAR